MAHRFLPSYFLTITNGIKPIFSVFALLNVFPFQFPENLSFSLKATFNRYVCEAIFPPKKVKFEEQKPYILFTSHVSKILKCFQDIIFIVYNLGSRKGEGCKFVIYLLVLLHLKNLTCGLA